LEARIVEHLNKYMHTATNITGHNPFLLSGKQTSIVS